MNTNRLQDHCAALYGAEEGASVAARVGELLARWAPRLPQARASGLSPGDALLISYGDQLSEPGVPPLRTLAAFGEGQLAGLVSGVHILPFFPWTSDDGFAVSDYRAVDPALGDWDDVARLGRSFRLMFDAVINHVSSAHAWFQGFLRDDPRYRDYFVTVAGDPDLSRVVRPRALPLLTRVDTAAGPRAVWTTFSTDQVDLNYRNPEVLLEVLDVLLFYAAQGASLLRLDAIAYLWKEIGTSSIHRPETHRLIQLLRAALDRVAPHVLLVSETNVPHADNVAYFGDGTNEAQLVYNFALPPLVLHSLRTGSAGALSAWAAGLAVPSRQATFFNFLASHDGIGLNPVRGILAPDDIDRLVEQVRQHGGLVSFKHEPDGSQTPYELNVNYFDALSDPASAEPPERAVSRFMVAQAIMLALAGVPGIYFHSLFGSRGWPEGARATGRARTINRAKLARAALEAELADPPSRRAQVFGRFAELLRARRAPAFDPYGSQRVLDAGPSVFALLREAPGAPAVVCLHELAGRPKAVDLDATGWPGAAGARSGAVRDLVSGRRVALEPDGALALGPYQVLWLSA